MNENATTVLDAVREMNYIRLSNQVADITGPDSETSEGARFVSLVRDALVEALEWKVENDDVDLAQAARIVREDSHELADAAVPVYTHNRWLTFADLAAWQVDVSEYASGDQDMTTLAGIALYEVARQLVDELCQFVEEQWYELEDQGEDDDEPDDTQDVALDADPGE